MEFCYYKKAEYANLSDDQKLELKEWRDQNPSNKQSHKRKGSGKDEEPPTTKKALRKVVASVFKEEAKKLKRQEDDANEVNELRDLITSLTSKNQSSTSRASASSTTATDTTTNAIANADTATQLATALQGIACHNNSRSGGSSA